MVNYSIEKGNEPQIKAPRVTPLEGVSTHGCAMRVRGVENPQGFGIDERRFVHGSYFASVLMWSIIENSGRGAL